MIMGDRTVISLRDWKVFNKVIPKYIKNNMNIEQAVDLLYLRGYITKEKKQILETICCSEVRNKDKNRKLLIELLTTLDFNDIVRFLRDIGQNSFANELQMERYSRGIIIPSHGSDIAVRYGTFTYYNNLKIQMDNNIFHDRIIELVRRSAFLKGSLTIETNPTKRQRLVDRYAVVTYQKVAQYRDREDRVKMLQEMKDSLPTDVDGTFTNIIYLCKMAVTEMHAGNEELAKEYTSEAFKLCDGCQQTFVKVFLCHDLQFVSRILHSSSHTDRHLKDTISGGDLGLLFMQEEQDDSAKIWNRVFLSENAMGLLKIRSNFKVILEETVDENDIRHAEMLLEHLVTKQGPLEIRREMIYFLCQARISELRADLDEAKDYALKAKILAEEGVHFENDKTNIADYYDYLCGK
ncbi:uncharacterized protein LOC123553232 [Mercenaria mercenaria]|uniref:uncharacterized protein LOC123553232 n=1 Tax=Mercenaria mercenaria TaxID=6596 RepID=UPI00234F22B6|nr:uncharacterized protein LOC123553232 [Mercenaria mercenaria]